MPAVATRPLGVAAGAFVLGYTYAAAYVLAALVHGVAKLFGA